MSIITHPQIGKPIPEPERPNQKECPHCHRSYEVARQGKCPKCGKKVSNG